jgi:hypothetical protein
MVGKALGVLCVVCFLLINATPVLVRGGVLDDVTAPVTSISFDPLSNERGWWNNSTTVTLTAVDDDSGVNATYFRINNGSWGVYAAPFAMSDEGVTVLEFYSVDNAGNVEEVQLVEVRIDVTAPLVSIALDPPAPNGENGWYVSRINVTLNASDGLSGVNATFYRINDGNWTLYTWTFFIGQLPRDSGNFSIEFYAVDNADNIGIGQPVTVKVDTELPQIAVSTQTFFNKIRYLATCWDRVSGMNRVEFYLNGKLVANVTTEPYEYILCPIPGFNYFTLKGFIYNPQVVGDTISIPVILGVTRKIWDWTMTAWAIDNAGNSVTVDHTGSSLPRLVLFRTLVVPNNYTGFLGQFYVRATFPIEPSSLVS